MKNFDEKDKNKRTFNFFDINKPKKEDFMPRRVSQMDMSGMFG